MTEQPAGVPSERTRRRPGVSRVAVPLALVLGSAAVVAGTLVGLEALVRLHAPDHLFLTRLHVFSQTYGWAPRRSTGGEVDGKRVTFNASGYRGRELPLPKRGDRTRVVVLGDSVAFGLGVSDDETFSSLLDVRDNGIEAGNLAVQGYGPDQELLVLMHQGLRADPDVVVLAFCLANDFVDAVLPVSLYDGRTPKPQFRLAGDRLLLDDSNLRQPALRRVQQWLSDHSHLFERLTAAPAAPTEGESDWHARYKAALGDEDYVLRLNLALVRRMRDLCQERGSAFLVALFPDRSSYRESSPLEKGFCEALRSDGVQVVDMSQHFKMSGQRWKAFAFDGVGHLTPLGHSIASEVLEREIVSRAQWASRS